MKTVLPVMKFLMRRPRPDLCPAYGHPPVTYNPWMDQSWCLCGAAIRPGDVVELPKPNLHGGPLWECSLDGCGCRSATPVKTSA